MGGLTDRDFQEAAVALGCDEATIRAVDAVESTGGGFWSDGTLKVLFEGHHFHRLTSGRFASTHPTLSYRSWTREHYARGATAEARGLGEWRRLQAAMELDREAALMSASMGRFQIMGSNYAACGFADVEAFSAAMLAGEREQLSAFCEFVRRRAPLLAGLRNHDWAAVARGYNGPAYATNQYHIKLEAAYGRFAAALKAEEA